MTFGFSCPSVWPLLFSAQLLELSFGVDNPTEQYKLLHVMASSVKIGRMKERKKKGCRSNMINNPALDHQQQLLQADLVQLRLDVHFIIGTKE